MTKWYDDNGDVFDPRRDPNNFAPGPPPGGGIANPTPAPPGSAVPVPPAPLDFGNFDIPNYNGPMSPSYNFQGPPDFIPPQFNAPSFADAQNEPGYQFRLQSGRSALDNSAAAKGTLRTGGSLKDLIEYGQNFGAQEYQNVFNRALQGYGAKYTAAKDAYAPHFAQYQNQFGAEQSRSTAEFNRAWDIYYANLQAQLEKERLAAQIAGG